MNEESGLVWVWYGMLYGWYVCAVCRLQLSSAFLDGLISVLMLAGMGGQEVDTYKLFRSQHV